MSDINTLKLSAEFGTSPVGSEVRSWDWSEDDNGYKTRYEFDTIPDEAITVTSPWTERTAQYMLNTLTLWAPRSADMVTRFTVSDGNGSFTASSWMRLSEALELFTSFLEMVGLK